MPRLRFTANALTNLEELDLPETALDKLDETFDMVCKFPNAGNRSELAQAQGKNIREKSVRVGRAGYSFLYFYDEEQDLIIILAVKAYRQNLFTFTD